MTVENLRFIFSYFSKLMKYFCSFSNLLKIIYFLRKDNLQLLETLLCFITPLFEFMVFTAYLGCPIKP